MTTRRKLHADLIPRAERLAALGMPLAAIARACNVHRATLHRWRTEAAGEGLERDLCDAIERGYIEGEMTLVQRLFNAAHAGDTRAAQWLLTHTPAWREQWSDAGAERTVQRQTLKLVVEVISRSGLSPEEQDHLLLQLEARGLGGVRDEANCGNP